MEALLLDVIYIRDWSLFPGGGGGKRGHKIIVQAVGCGGKISVHRHLKAILTDFQGGVKMYFAIVVPWPKVQ